MYEVLWEKKAFKQLMAIRHDHRKPITEAVAGLQSWPVCCGVMFLAGQ